ncbi:hypothetical protein IAG25_21430 [Caballeronia sp. EK]|uniref:hypothetical protein n=1 Tax=Caballeronia sp. EK TaxID=2767469 RepID=UPI00165624FE|nr:hypothetical protein [Caballeronia sp. EK]MBC8639393.1 hypothetical protein [Caballeronia sp. EK]
MLNFTDEQIALNELRNAAYHEAGHKMLYERFGGAGDAVVWRHQSGNPEETAWIGQSSSHLSRGDAQDGDDAGGTAPDLPTNWTVLVGMGGLLAETIVSGETDDIDVMAHILSFRI